MGFKYRLEILTILAILGFCALFLYTSSIMTEAEFAGADTQGSALVAEITGKSDEEFHPLIWQWSPPSGEIEAGIFALQAAIGGIMVGWVFGYWKGQKKTV
ncbi:MAG TPA: cobalt transport protein CbiN [Methanoregulaceae archaeon]|jgi:cobalt/nickel transport protein|nr:cobalt transport protein CbiN [Methanoregulaceae archaeon]HOH80045.1 cobalt transport protein CbiN [Methanoregulaceae archaeon]HPW10469.1 cobalt transport protein CbiN [Methanoregulaceae archaeon]HQM55988.1 cobalt transport protein CbiN [Methanoregulaceae archaeon]